MRFCLTPRARAASLFRVTRPSEEEATAPFTILVVCSGNTCRSPFAEGLLRRLLADRLRIPVQIFSAGTSAVAGAPVTPNALRAAQEHGVDLAGRSSTPLTVDLIERADMILAMEKSHRDRISRMSRAAAAKTRVVTELAPESGLAEVPDPFGSGIETYRRCFRDLRTILTEALPLLAETVEHDESRPGRDAAPGA